MKHQIKWTIYEHIIHPMAVVFVFVVDNLKFDKGST